MKTSRGPSPTPTAFSGISNYRTDSYRPLRDLKGAPAVPTIDYRQVSKIYYAEFRKYLASYLASYLDKVPSNSRLRARSKLTELTIHQFHELSTDVYDELVRRKNENEVLFLPVRDEFHPKRNRARQKLATLSASRFEDLSSDVYFELSCRYPEFKEDIAQEILDNLAELKPGIVDMDTVRSTQQLANDNTARARAQYESRIRDEEAAGALRQVKEQERVAAEEASRWVQQRQQLMQEARKQRMTSPTSLKSPKFPKVLPLQPPDLTFMRPNVQVKEQERVAAEEASRWVQQRQQLMQEASRQQMTSSTARCLCRDRDLKVRLTLRMVKVKVEDLSIRKSREEQEAIVKRQYESLTSE